MKLNVKASNVSYFGQEIGLRYLEGEQIYFYIFAMSIFTLGYIWSLLFGTAVRVFLSGTEVTSYMPLVQNAWNSTSILNM